MERLKEMIVAWNQKPLSSRLWIIFVILLVLATEGKEYFKNPKRSNEVRVVSARRKLSAGTHLSIHDLSVTHVGVSEEKQYFNEQELHEVIGSELKEDLEIDKPIKKEQVQPVGERRFSVKVPKGLRAYPIHFSSKLPVEPRDKLDIIGRTELSQKTELLVEDRKVLAVKPDELGQEIVLAVTPQDAALLDSFKDHGNFSFMLRNPEDLDFNGTKKAIPKKEARRIELWE